MTDRDYRFGFNGEGRDLGYGDGKKVAAGAITSAYRVDTTSIGECEEIFNQSNAKGFMPRPAAGGFRLLEGEMAFTVRGSGGRVRTALNGLDARLAEVYPNDPELVRQLLYELIQPIGFVEEDAETGKAEPLVTLRTGGTHPAGAPSTYNFGDQTTFGMPTSPHIVVGSMVVYDVPNLKNPIQFGNPASGVPAGKVRLVARALDKRSAATRIVMMVGTLNRNPEKFKAALRDHPGVAHTWMRVGRTVVRSYETAFLLGLDLLLRRGILQVPGAAPLAGPLQPVNELLGAAGAGGVREPLTPEDTIVRMAEYLGLINQSSTASAALTPQARTAWRELEFELRNRMVPAPDPSTQQVNAAYQFGFVVNRVDGTYASRARVNGTGAIKDDSMGKFFKMTLVHFQQMLEAVVGAVFHERKNAMGVALTEPSVRGTSQFQMYVQPHGGMSDMN